MAEIVPVRLRGGIGVLMGGIGTVGGYLAASAFAAWLEPEFGWRILWLIGLPTGVILIMLNRYIPESPRFLLAQGRTDEAHRVGVAAFWRHRRSSRAAWTTRFGRVGKHGFGGQSGRVVPQTVDWADIWTQFLRHRLGTR